MTRAPLHLLLILAVLVLGCEAAPCPDGFVRRHDGGACIPIGPADAGPSDASGIGDSSPADAGASDAGGGAVECLGPGDCSAPTAMCDTTSNLCVSCLADGDCTDPTMARCDAGACVPCTDAGQCIGIAGRGLCETGDCVECTAADASACGVSPCTAANVCSAFGAMARDTCESCDTDTNCMSDHACVPMQYMGIDRANAYCLRLVSAGCARPFSVETPVRTTLSDVMGRTYCGINETLATCEAVRALEDDTPQCPGGTDAECPESGLCRTVGVLTDRCTYECGAAIQCPMTPPLNTCDNGTPPDGVDYCGG